MNRHYCWLRWKYGRKDSFARSIFIRSKCCRIKRKSYYPYTINFTYFFHNRIFNERKIRQRFIFLLSIIVHALAKFKVSVIVQNISNCEVANKCICEYIRKINLLFELMLRLILIKNRIEDNQIIICTFGFILHSYRN